MRYAAVFAVLTAGLLLVASTASLPARVLLISCALSSGGLSLAYALRNPLLLGKRSNGTMSPAYYLFFWPYLVVSFVSLWLFRRLSSEGPISEIAPDLFLGCRLFRTDRSAFEERRIRSTLDLTSELSEVGFAREVDAYLCLPLLDTLAPSREQIALAADWIGRRLREGPVFVHCALGHGRSAAIVAAYLVQSARASTASEAIALIEALRPGVGLRAQQTLALEDYARSLARGSET